MSRPHVYVGMSGGVDSSVTAALLLEQGYQVTGVYMKNWAQDLPGFVCPWRDDLADAKRVAVQLGIPFKIFDFQTEYKQKVVDYMVAEYQAGRTPNPDIMCNQEVKFKLFLNAALEDGADLIATGHYARIADNSVSTTIQKPNFKQPPNSNLQPPKSTLYLMQAVDDNKDQTYFLYRMPHAALAKTLFPLGNMTKPEVRAKAKQLGLITAAKKDSVGICFVGQVGIKEFLQNFVNAEPGKIIDRATNKAIGQHDGAIFYTIGQRHGLGVGGGLPYYVVGKNMAKNEVYVSDNLDSAGLWSDRVVLTNVHWISAKPNQSSNLTVRLRHRGALVAIKSLELTEMGAELKLKDEVRALAPGQSAVLYQGEVCLGGGIIS